MPSVPAPETTPVESAENVSLLLRNTSLTTVIFVEYPYFVGCLQTGLNGFLGYTVAKARDLTWFTRLFSS